MNRLLSCVMIAVLGGTASSCQDNHPAPPSSSPTAVHIEDNTVISAEPSENVSVEDYWDEARSIRSVAEQIMVRAAGTGCYEARRQALYSISLSEKAEISHNLLQAERLTGQANEALIDAEDALTACEEKIDMVYPASLHTKER